jgi:hypothetical protein
MMTAPCIRVHKKKGISIMARTGSSKMMRKRRRIRNKRLRHLKPTKKGWKVS